MVAGDPKPTIVYKLPKFNHFQLNNNRFSYVLAAALGIFPSFRNALTLLFKFANDGPGFDRTGMFLISTVYMVLTVVNIQPISYAGRSLNDI